MSLPLPPLNALPPARISIEFVKQFAANMQPIVDLIGSANDALASYVEISNRIVYQKAVAILFFCSFAHIDQHEKFMQN